MAEQVDPLKFFGLLKWLDGQPLLDVMEPYRQTVLREALWTFRDDGAPQYKRVLTGRAKKNSKTADAVLAALYKLLAWHPAGNKGNQVFFVASDLGQANDDLDLAKKLIRCNPILDAELTLLRNVVERKDGQGFLEILPAGDAPGLHGKTFLFLVVDELHTQKDYRLLEALEVDRTRPDATQWFASYAAVSPTPGYPINDFLRQNHVKSDPRLFVSWYSGTIEEANPSLNGLLGPTMADILDAQRALPSWIFRRLYQNLPGQPDNAAFNAEIVQRCVVTGRTTLSPQPGMIYSAFVDMSGGGDDDATLAISHRQDGQVVLDLLIDQGPRRGRQTFSPQQTVERFAAILKEYGCHAVTGDRYAGEWPRQAFEKCGIVYRVADRTRSQLYAALEPLLNSGRVELLDGSTLLTQLIGLVRKGEKIDHLSGEHDDHANAAAGALTLAAAESIPLMFYSAGRIVGAEPMPTERPSLITRATAVLDRGIEALTTTVADVGRKLTDAKQAVADQLGPPLTPEDARRIRSLAPGVRQPDEEAALDRFEVWMQRHQPETEVERHVRRCGIYWPSDSLPRAEPKFDHQLLESIRLQYDAMRNG